MDIRLIGLAAASLILPAVLSGCDAPPPKDPATARLTAELNLLQAHKGQASSDCLKAMKDFNASADLVINNQTVSKADPVSVDIMEGNRLIAERSCRAGAEAICDTADTLPPEQMQACQILHTIPAPRYY
ncbi:hypothetical protein [Granulibacter bethesdensis]|uniref:hypothetical protein n=1 Tax=Granulibacter bethesdensis TaxID=364410 RepID=UPI0003F1D77B|nr:hypothetical protein [Granulibacter bethesdensis]AHJ64690.1 putative secreted protein [Granulibacter bethesdensis CGDNIH4]